MKRKILSLLLVSVVVIGMFPISTIPAYATVIVTEEETSAPECEHSWVDATCTAPRTCSECGATEGEAKGHSWDTNGECINCNAKCDHNRYKDGECTDCGFGCSVSAVLETTMDQLAATVTAPSFGTNYGEWTVFALARGDYYAKDNEYFTDYYARIVEYVNTTAAEINLNGALDKNKSTDNARLIVALSAIGIDATSVGDWDIVEAYSANGINWIKKQGINGTIWALIALDSNNYETSDSTIRQQCVDSILSMQHNDGGWSLVTAKAQPSNVDITGMALTALYPYRDQPEVSEACATAFAWLSESQLDNGGFPYGKGETSESCAWAIVAATTWGINPHTDPRFVKSGCSAVDNLLTYFVEDEVMFAHIRGAGSNAMATDQATYALVAYNRFVNGDTALFDYSDVTFDPPVVPKEPEEPEKPEEPEEPETPEEPDEKSITVTMRLIGAELAEQDVDLGLSAYLPDYVTWIPTTVFTLEEGATVYDLWVAATEYAGIRSRGAERNYVDTVWAPAQFGGYDLSEFTNGYRSGWMYTINGSHPGYGLCEQELEDGDVVVWHYVNDYAYEVEDWFDDADYPALGDGTYWNLWLGAPDYFGGAGGGINEPDETDEPEVTVNSDGSTTTTTIDEDGNVTETTETVDGTTATVVTDAKGNVTEMKAEVSEKAARTEVVTIPIRVAAARTKAKAVAVKIAVPKTVKVEILVENITAGTVIFIVDEEGNETILPTAAMTENGLAITVKGNATVKVVDNTKGFVDDDMWAQEAIEFVTAREIFNGTSGDTFSPKQAMTRAMLMTVLARLDGVDTNGGATWYEIGMNWARENGVSDGTNPNGNITREQLATMLYRYAGEPATDGSLANFTDAGEVSSYAEKSMRWAVENGIINGMGDGTLNPKGEATRAQLAKILMYFINL